MAKVIKEAVPKCKLIAKQTVQEQLDNTMKKEQAICRCGLLEQLSALHCLLRHGITIWGHIDSENVIKDWLSRGKYMSHDMVNEHIQTIANTVLQLHLSKITTNYSPWYSIIGNEASDTAGREQLHLSIRWVNEDYIVSKNPVGLASIPSTTSDVLTKVIKDMLIRFCLLITFRRGQAFDGAANKQGHGNGVITQIKSENPVAVSIHCFAHCLNLCLQENRGSM
uniref:Uncharacterized protein n=1 Tax=Amphimedon queenslandica TaxID=400682 RepID=A0A1X7UDU2_AMPQE